MIEGDASMTKNERIDWQHRNKHEIIDELMRLYSKDVFLLAYSYVKDHALAEDISQEVFLKCYQFLENFRGDSSVKSWIFRITANTCKNVLRKRRLNVVNIASQFLENIRKTESTEDFFVRNQENEALLQTVLSLSQKYREVIVLYYFHELKTEEISDMLRLNHNTVKTRLARGRSLLKERLEPKKGEMFHES